MNADGSGIRQLTNDTAIDFSPDWSPDGKKIAFRSHHDGLADIYVINVDGSNLRNLINRLTPCQVRNREFLITRSFQLN